MCLPNFERFEQISKDSPLIGYRSWRNKKESLDLKSENQEYIWVPVVTGPHEVLEFNSGIYAYYNYNNNYYNYNNYYNNYNNNIGGIILQYGKVAIHREGQRSEFAKIDKLLLIREEDAQGSKEFLNWIKKFNIHVKQIAERYEAFTISWQDFKESKK